MKRLLPSTKPNPVQQAQIARRYGMFIHFGINTFFDKEWSDGTLPASGYKPTAIDADGWVRNAYEAGMNYVILITKHHDGFCLWDTQYTDYGVNNSGNKTDVVAEVAKACTRYGVGLGLYYSLWDRHERCYRDDAAYTEYMCRQLTELLGGKYGKVVELWLDGGWDKRPKRWHLDKIYDLVHTLQPDCAVAVNTTIGNPRRKKPSNRYLPERYREGMPIKYFPSDFRLFDPHFTREDDPKLYAHDGELYYLPFEATICIRNMNNWFWDSKYAADKPVEKDFIVEKYRLLTERQNLLVVNVAPDADGKQIEGDIRRLQEVAEELGIARKA